MNCCTLESPPPLLSARLKAVAFARARGREEGWTTGETPPRDVTQNGEPGAVGWG